MRTHDGDETRNLLLLLLVASADEQECTLYIFFASAGDNTLVPLPGGAVGDGRVHTGGRYLVRWMHHGGDVSGNQEHLWHRFEEWCDAAA